jgi:hypothetical protein
MANGALRQPLPLGDGVHNLRVFASDAAGNTSTTTPAFAITVDATPPTNPVVTGVSMISGR